MMAKFEIFVTILVLCCFNAANSYKIGVGRADCTGPPVEIVFVSKKKLFTLKTLKIGCCQYYYVGYSIRYVNNE